jgi:hypothetical protein
MHITYCVGKLAVRGFAVLFVAYLASACASPSWTEENSWSFRFHPSETDLGPGGESGADDSTLDITLVMSGHLICGHYDGTIARQQPKTDAFYFVGSLSSGVAHVYFPNDFSGVKGDNGEATITWNRSTLRWIVTRPPRTENYIYLDNVLSPVRPDSRAIKRLESKCASIRRVFWQIDKHNAIDAVSRINALKFDVD